MMSCLLLRREGGKVLLIENKSGKDHYRPNSMDNVLDISEYGIGEGCVFRGGNLQVRGKVTYYPIYMILFLQKGELPSEIYFDLGLSDLNKSFKEK